MKLDSLIYGDHELKTDYLFRRCTSNHQHRTQKGRGLGIMQRMTPLTSGLETSQGHQVPSPELAPRAHTPLVSPAKSVQWWAFRVSQIILLVSIFGVTIFLFTSRILNFQGSHYMPVSLWRSMCRLPSRGAAGRAHFPNSGEGWGNSYTMGSGARDKPQGAVRVSSPQWKAGELNLAKVSRNRCPVPFITRSILVTPAKKLFFF